MPKDFTVQATIRAKDEASSTIRGVESRFSKLSGSLGGALKVGVGLASTAVGGLALAFRSSVSAASEAEDAAKRLNNALSPLGASAAGVSQALREQADALQQVTRFDDDAIVSGQALLAIYVKNEEQLKAGTQAAVDFAAATGTDISVAFKLIAKAAAGNTAALSRYGIVLDENIPKGEKFAAVLGAVNATMGGRAVEDAKTYSGAVAVLGNSFGELQEKAGQAVTGNKDVIRSLRDLNTVLRSEGLTENVSKLSGWLVELGTKALGGLALAFDDPLLALRAFFQVTEAQIELSNKFNPALQKQAAAVEAVATATERATRIAREHTEATTAAVAAAERFGFTLEAQVRAAIEKNNAALIAADNAYRSGAISIRDYNVTLAAVGIENAKLKLSLESTAAALGDTAPAAEKSAAAIETVAVASESAATGLAEVAAEAPAVSSALASAGSQAVITSAQFDALSDAMGRAAAVQAALAGGATTSQGGTRIRLGGFSDGSRLATPAGGAANAGGSGAGGTFTAPIKRYYVDGFGRVVPF